MVTKSKLKHQNGLQLDLNALFCQTPLPDYIISPGSVKAYDFLKEWRTAIRSTIDLETAETATGNGLDPFRGKIRLFQVLLPSGKLLIVDAFKDFKDVKFQSEFLGVLQTVLANPDHLIVGQNLYFDLLWLRVQYGFRAVGVRDTKILAQSLRSGIKTQRFGLKDLCSWLLDVDLSKDLQTSNWNLPDLSNDQLIYAAKDVIYTEQCYLALCKLIHKHRDTPDINGNPCQRTLVEVAKIECEAIPAFVEIAYNGYPINLDVCKQLIADYDHAIADLYAPVQKRLNNLPYSAFSADLAAAIYDCHGIWLLQEKTVNQILKEEAAKKGGENADEDAVAPKQLSLFGKVYPDIPKTHVLTTNSACLFAYFLETGNEDLLVISLVRSLKKLKDTLISLRDSALQNNSRALSRYNSLGNTGSGRSTSSGDNKSTTISLNLQNLPNPLEHPLVEKYKLKPIRYCIQPPSGRKLSIQDLSASHSRLCAMLSKDETLLSTLDEKDPHLLGTARLMSIVKNKEVTLDDLKARGGKKDPEINGYRALYKVFYYLSLNVGGAKRLLAVLNKDFQSCSMEIAQACAASFKETFPEVVKWQKTLHKNAAKVVVEIPVQLKSGRKYKQKYAQFRIPDGRLFHAAMYENEDFNGNKVWQPKINDCTSVSLISPEALLEKQSMTEILALNRLGKYSSEFKLIGMCHDEMVLEFPDTEEGFNYAQEVNQIIAKNFQAALAFVPSGMRSTDKEVQSTFANNYSEK